MARSSSQIIVGRPCALGDATRGGNTPPQSYAGSALPGQFVPDLWLVLPGSQQESVAPLVQHGNVRRGREVATLLPEI